MDFNNSSVIEMSSEYSYFHKMVAVIRGAVAGGLGAFNPPNPPPPISSYPPQVKGKINIMAFPQHSTKNIIVTASVAESSTAFGISPRPLVQ